MIVKRAKNSTAHGKLASMFLLPVDFWEIRNTKEKGNGVFAKKEIPAGTIIGDYIGKVIELAQYDVEEDKKGLYLMYFTDEVGIYPDLEKPDIHLINHACQPNCWIYVHKGHTLFFVLRDIIPGEELTISYLLSPKDETCAPCTHMCKCESKFCTGSMHLSKGRYEKWQKFLNKERKKTKMVPFTIGENLKKLDFYPKINFSDQIYKSMRSLPIESF